MANGAETARNCASITNISMTQRTIAWRSLAPFSAGRVMDSENEQFGQPHTHIYIYIYWTNGRDAVIGRHATPGTRDGVRNYAAHILNTLRARVCFRSRMAYHNKGRWAPYTPVSSRKHSIHTNRRRRSTTEYTIIPPLAGGLAHWRASLYLRDLMNAVRAQARANESFKPLLRLRSKRNSIPRGRARAGERFYHFARIKQLDISITRAHLYISRRRRRRRSRHAICGHTSGNVYSSLLACWPGRGGRIDECSCI